MFSKPCKVHNLRAILASNYIHLLFLEYPLPILFEWRQFVNVLFEDVIMNSSSSIFSWVGGNYLHACFQGVKNMGH